MEPLDATGSFWLPGHDNVTRHGSLTFDAIDGSTVMLNDGLGERMPDGSIKQGLGGTWDRVFGYIDRQGQRVPVTLIECGGFSQKSYFVNAILIGGNFGVEDSVFEAAHIRLADLAPWVAQDALTVVVDHAIDGVARRELDARLDRPTAQSASFTGGDLSLDFRWSREDVEYERLTVEQWPQFELTYSKPTELMEILEHTGSLQSLCSLCVNRIGSVDAFYLFRSDHPERVLSGRPIPGTRRPIELKARLDGIDRQRPGSRMGRGNMLVSYADLGGTATIARWLDREKSLRAIVGSLLTMLTSTMYAENRFLNVCSAAEGLHRATIGGSYMDKAEFKTLSRRLRKSLPQSRRAWFASQMAHANDPSLNQRLRDLASQLGGFADAVVGDTSEWAKVVSRCRNDLTHLDVDRAVYGGENLHWISESVFNIARLCVLLHVGLEQNVLPTVLKSWPLWGARDRTERVVERFSEMQSR